MPLIFHGLFLILMLANKKNIIFAESLGRPARFFWVATVQMQIHFKNYNYVSYYKYKFR